MEAAIVLNVRVLAEDDEIVVTAKRYLMPDRAVRADAHGADDAAVGAIKALASISGTRSMKGAI